MATDDPHRTERVVTKAGFARVYKWLTVVALAVFLVAFVRPSLVPSVVTNTVVGAWLLASLLAFAHLGIRDSTHGV